MSKKFLKPGVYIEEKNVFPNSVVEVATAIPAFIGYTEKAIRGDRSILNKPYKITSLEEFHILFGGAPNPGFFITEETGEISPSFVVGNKQYNIEQDNFRSLFYDSLRLFYANGGGECYIVSVGDYSTEIDVNALVAGIDTLSQEQEPTLLVIPESTLLSDVESSAEVHKAMLNHCANNNRFAILDIWNGFNHRNTPDEDCVQEFRDKIGTNFLSFGASYYPWLNTSLGRDEDLTYLNISNRDLLQTIIMEELLPENQKISDTIKVELKNKIAEITKDDLSVVEKEILHKTMVTISPGYNDLIRALKDSLNLLPPGPAMAGIYKMVDNTRGVWKAPANISLNSVIKPSVNISHEEQENLNFDAISGKSINSIRSFPGVGTLAWGAKTLDGNSLDWKYINVRRTMIMFEQSIKMALRSYVFEPNDANTWVTVKSMIATFLTEKWKQGALAGASPDYAFDVQIGLGTTMTSEDILNGFMRISVNLAIVRPAEFINLTFEQQMQKK